MDSQEKLKAVQSVELRMLKDVAAFCDARGLRCYLYCGTLLGAVRHHGFIPWDDDVDLAMPLSDYRRFLALSRDLAGYTVEAPETNPWHYCTWIKVYKDGTAFFEPDLAGYPVHKGISLDIYPILSAAEGRLGRKWQQFWLRGAKTLLASGYHRLHGEVKHPLAKMAAHLPVWLTRRLGLLCWHLMCRDDGRSRCVSTVDGAPFEPKYLRKDWEETVLLPFEDAMFPAPAAWDKFLTRMYGDYMTLPAVWARVNHIEKMGDGLIVSADRDYREIEKEYLQA